MVSIIEGQIGHAMALWGAVARSKGHQIRVVPHSKCEELPGLFDFFHRHDLGVQRSSALLIVPDAIAVPEITACFDFAANHPSRQLGVVLKHAEISAFLEDPEVAPLAQQNLLSGLVSIPVATPPQVLKDGEVYYRSVYEEILHKLVDASPDIKVQFEPNRRRQGASGKSYEIDLFCDELNIAIEIDGPQHWQSSHWKKADQKKANDLRENNITIYRVRTDHIVSDPTKVIAYLVSELNKHS